MHRPTHIEPTQDPVHRPISKGLVQIVRNLLSMQRHTHLASAELASSNKAIPTARRAATILMGTSLT